MIQLALIEPTGGELLPLIVGQLRAADKCVAQAALCFSRGLLASVESHTAQAQAHWLEADELEMLLMFEAFGGVHQ